MNGTAMTKTIKITNGREATHELMLEPLGERYMVPSGGTAKVTSNYEFGDSLEINLSPNRTSVWIMGGPDYHETLVVAIDGTVQQR